ncbi:MAG: hypothetical protein OER85_07645 [Gammaproteobacteria bacterium]|nr:hypothetical protein [Gammaproteobacteria bacterium]
MRRLVFSILTILISFSSALLLAEIALRIVWTPPTLRSTPMGETHPYCRVAPRPGVSGKHYTSEYETSFSHTPQGLRGDRLYHRTRPAGIKKRVLFLGDSFTYGEGSSNNEAFVALLVRPGQILMKRAGH